MEMNKVQGSAILIGRWIFRHRRRQSSRPHFQAYVWAFFVREPLKFVWYLWLIDYEAFTDSYGDSWMTHMVTNGWDIYLSYVVCNRIFDESIYRKNHIWMVFGPSERFHVFSYANNMEILFHKNYMDILLGYFAVVSDLDFDAGPSRKWRPEVVRGSYRKSHWSRYSGLLMVVR